MPVKIWPLFLCLGCAPVVHETRPVIEATTTDPWLRTVLSSVPVEFVPGSVRELCPDKWGHDGLFHEAAGCVVDCAGAPHIYVSTINLDAAESRLVFRYWQDILEHEYRHVLGWIGRDE